jgi:hypothetical protein
MKSGIPADYSKLAMEDTDDTTLGLELGLGGYRGLKSNRNDDSYDELNQLIM